MTYVVDIDGTLCTLTDGDYKKAKPNKKRIEKINKLFKEGNTVYYIQREVWGVFTEMHGEAIMNFFSSPKNNLKSGAYCTTS